MRTYGTAELRDDQWIIKCDPHVAIRFRRIFKCAGRQIGEIKLQATGEHSRDILWFTKRYPLEVTPQDALVEQADEYDRQVESFDKLLSGVIEPRAFDMALPPRHYQRIAADLGLTSRGLLIADDLGLGKTISAIAMLTDPDTRPALVVTLTHLPIQWQSELLRFAPELRTTIIRKVTPYDLGNNGRVRKRVGGQMRLIPADECTPRFPDVLICSYSKLAGWAEALSGRVRTVIFDEVQELRRDESMRSKAAVYLAQSARYRIGLSATPIYNFGIEFFNVMQALKPGALGSRSEFLEEWCKGCHDPKNAIIADPVAFGSYVRESGMMIRRTRKDVSRELPSLTKSVIYLDTDQADIDRMVGKGAEELARIILEKSSDWKAKGLAARELDWKLRQATGVAKAPYVADFVKMLVEAGESVVLYGWHRAVYDIWAERLMSYKPVFFTGAQSTAQKEKSKKSFCGGDSKILIMSLRSGAGLDGLQHHTRTVVCGELDWSPKVHDQGIGRVHRDGQPDPVIAYFPVSRSGSDPVVMDVLGLKRDQIDGIVNQETDVLASREDGANRMRKLAEHYIKRHDSHDNEG